MHPVSEWRLMALEWTLYILESLNAITAGVTVRNRAQSQSQITIQQKIGAIRFPFVLLSARLTSTLEVAQTLNNTRLS